jgi:ABC-type polysaccharide/polyol phosphate transport system ATPase subunit
VFLTSYKRSFLQIMFFPFPTPEQVAFAVKEAGQAYKAYTQHKALILELFDFAWHRGQMPTFIVFGPGGNGKSTLQKFLAQVSFLTMSAPIPDISGFAI